MTQAELFDRSDDTSNPHWAPSRAAGLERLTNYIANAGKTYSSTRNFDFGPDQRGNVSALSPWIRHRLITEDEILQTTLSKHGFSAAEKFIMEVFWRAYFKGWLEQHPDVWAMYLEDLHSAHEAVGKDKNLRQRHEQAISGETGIECFDFWALELKQSGYLHNHARMWFASIWIFTLRLPWTLGADFFYSHLLDGDPASNTLSWRWVAGLHTKGKHYVARASNIEKFTNNRFNPIGDLNESPDALSEDWDVEQSLMPISDSVDHSCKSALLITEEDYSPSAFELVKTPSEVVILNRNLEGLSARVKEFKTGALEDTQKRASADFGVPVTQISAHDLPTWAEKNSIQQLVTSYLPVGPVCDEIASIKPSLDQSNIRFAQVVSQHDQQAWPHATRGFFKLKKKIPTILKNKGL